MIKAAGLLLLFALATSCTAPAANDAAAAAPATTGGSVEMRTLTTGTHAAAQPRTRQAIEARDAARFREVWESSIGAGSPPPIDFASESAVILLGGSKPTGGWTVVPKGAMLDGDTLVIDAEVKGPPPDAIVTQAFTSPFAVIAVKTKDFTSVRW